MDNKLVEASLCSDRVGQLKLLGNLAPVAGCGCDGEEVCVVVGEVAVDWLGCLCCWDLRGRGIGG